MSKFFQSLTGLVCILLLVACGQSSKEESIEVTSTLNLTQSAVGGFDDFGSPGAAFAYVVDENENAILAVALKFNLPLYSANFIVDSDFVNHAESYEVTNPVNPLANAVAAYPLLASLTTNTPGIRLMPSPITAVLIKGDLQQDVPEQIFVSDEGSLTLFREDGPSDILEGSLRMREVTSLGEGAEATSEGEVIQLEPFYIQWDTGDQSFRRF